MNESWSNKYKKSINCDNPKGFSQKAHCAGRKKRAMGGETKSKSPFKEDAPVNNVGGGAIAGVGVGPQGEPGVKKKKALMPFKMFTRKLPVK
jgi:hypothetical protein